MFGRRKPTPGKLRQQVIRENRERTSRHELARAPEPTFSLAQGPWIWWYGHQFPLDKFLNCVVTGTAGSGKTITSAKTFRSVVDAVPPGSGRKVVVIDPKGEYQSILEQMGRKYTLLSLTSSDGCAWDIAKDFSTPILLSQLNHILLPEVKADNPFFRNAARILGAGVSMSFQYRLGADWDFSDFYNAILSDEETLKQIIEGYPRGKDITQSLLDTRASETFDNIRSEIATVIEPLKIIAAQTQIAGKKKFSITEFLKGEGIVVVRVNPEMLDVEKPFLQAFLYRLFDAINAMPRTSRKDKIVWLDEFHFYGKIPRIDRLAEFSRGKGGLLYVIAQTIDSLRDEYGKEHAEAILGNFPFRAMHRTDSPSTAQWCASQFGKKEFREEMWNTSYGEKGPRPSVQYDRYVQDVVFDSAFLNLPFASEIEGIRCFLKSPHWGAELNKLLPWQAIASSLPPEEEVLLRPIPAQAQHPQLWTEERRRLCVEGRRRVRPATDLVSPLLSAFEEAIREGLYSIAEDVLVQKIWDEFMRS